MTVRRAGLRSLRAVVRAVRDVTGFQGHAEWVRRACARVSGDDILIEDFHGGTKFWCRLDEHIGSQIYWRGSYSTDQLDYLDRHLQPEMVFADVGANQGEFTVFAASRLRDGAVYAFEPVASLRDRLRKNVEVNGFRNVVIEPVGLGDRVGRLPIYTDIGRFGDGTENSGIGCLYRVGRCSRFVEQVELRTLDDWSEERDVQRLDFVKVDVEGAELSVLRGARRTIERTRPRLLVELDPENADRAGHTVGDLLRELRRLDYNVLGLSRGGHAVPFDGDTSRHKNVLCVPLS